MAETFCVTEDKDFSAQLSTIKPTNPDVIYAPNYYSPVALFTKQARELGVKAPVLAGDGAQADELIQIGGKEVEGVAFTGHFHPQATTTDLAKDWIARFEKKYPGKQPNAFHALGADAYFVLLDAITRANSMKGENIRAALATTKEFPRHFWKTLYRRRWQRGEADGHQCGQGRKVRIPDHRQSISR